MNEHSFLHNKVFEKSNVAIICIFGMGVGFLCSTALLSSATFLFGINGVRDVHPKYWLRNKWWLLGIAWVAMYALTYFWSADKGYWGVRLQTKLPFLLLPLSVAYLPAFKPKQLQLLTISLAVVLLYSAVYSLYFFAHDPAYYLYGYTVSHLLPTLPGRDHIRVSMAMALFIVWSIYVWPFLQDRLAKWFIGFMIVFIALFMHILASKSGLLSLYIFLTGWGLYVAFGKRKIIGIIALIAIPAVFVVVMNIIPTLRHRAEYISFSYLMLKKGDRSGNYGDVNRLMSYKVAALLIKDHPLIGVGMGNMLGEMTARYAQLYPEVRKEDVLLPHNQFLVVALGCGIPAVLVFAWWVFMPLGRLRKNRQSFYFFMVWLILLFQLMIEPVFEVQHGVYLFLFFLVLFMHELPGDKKASPATSSE